MLDLNELATRQLSGVQKFRCLFRPMLLPLYDGISVIIIILSLIVHSYVMASHSRRNRVLKI